MRQWSVHDRIIEDLAITPRRKPATKKKTNSYDRLKALLSTLNTQWYIINIIFNYLTQARARQYPYFRRTRSCNTKFSVSGLNFFLTSCYSVGLAFYWHRQHLYSYHLIYLCHIHTFKKCTNYSFCTIYTYTAPWYLGNTTPYPLLCGYSPLDSTIGCLRIPGGRYMHPAWFRTASDTVSSLGTDPWTPAVSLCP